MEDEAPPSSSSSSPSILPDDKSCSAVHLLPCNIQHDGPAPVKQYFHVDILPHQKNKPEKEILVSNFRGRRLEGISVPLPENTVGCVVHSNGLDNRLEVHSTFKSVTVWEHDHPPPDDVLDKSLEYFDIANIVHS